MSDKNTIQAQRNPTQSSLPEKQIKIEKKGKIVVKKLDLNNLSKAGQNIVKNTNRSDKDAPPQKSKLNVIHYKSKDTVKFDKTIGLSVETDQDFMIDVKSIADKNKNLIGNLLDIVSKEKTELTDQQCDQLDYIARTHYKANRVNQNTKHKQDQIDQNHKFNKCPCGCKRQKGKSLSFFASIDSMKYLGSGVLLMFMFIKALSIIMLIVLLAYGIFALATNLLGGQTPEAQSCDSDYCRFVNNSSNKNKIQPPIMMLIQWWLGLFFCVIWLISTRVIKYYGKKKHKQIDKRLKSASDLAVIIKKLPYGQYSQVQILQYFQRLHHRVTRQKHNRANYEDSQDYIKDNQQLKIDNGNNFNLKSIQIIYSVQFARNIIDKIIDLSIKLMKYVQIIPDKSKPEQNVYSITEKKEYTETKSQLIQYLQILGDLRKKFLYDQQFRKSISCQLCLLQFYKEEQKDQFLSYFGKQKLGLLTELQQKIKSYFIKKQQASFMFKGKYLHIQRAPQPSDIIWKNCQIPYSIKRTALLYLITIMIIIGSFGLIVALQFIQSYFITNKSSGQIQQNSNLITILNIVTAIILLIINKCLWFSLYYFLDQQYNYTLSQKINSHMNKSLFAISVNVIILPIISNWYIKDKVFGTNGLSGMVFDYQISCLLIGLPLKLLDPLEIVKRIALYIRFTRNKLIRNICRNLNLSLTSYKDKGIKQINSLYEGSLFDIAESYVYILGTIFHTAFFCQLQPAVIITGTLTTILFYFVLKAKLLYFCKIPQIIDKLVFQTALTQAALVPLIYGAGTIATSYIEVKIDKSRPLEYHQGVICICLGVIFFFNPGDIFNKLVIKLMSKIENIRFFDKKDEKQIMQIEDDYYRNSNSLDLLGFENKIKGQNINEDIRRELKNFCQQFFPKSYQKVFRRQNFKTEHI